jgi:hypothetical protein
MMLQTGEKAVTEKSYLDYFADLERRDAEKERERLVVSLRLQDVADRAQYGSPEKRTKFDASPAAAVTGTEIFSFSEPVNLSEVREKALVWARENGIYREDYTNTDTGWTDMPGFRAGSSCCRHGR